MKGVVMIYIGRTRSLVAYIYVPFDKVSLAGCLLPCVSYPLGQEYSLLPGRHVLIIEAYIRDEEVIIRLADVVFHVLRKPSVYWLPFVCAATWAKKFLRAVTLLQYVEVGC